MILLMGGVLRLICGMRQIRNRREKSDFFKKSDFFRLSFSEKRIVVCMGADPNPSDFVVLPESDGPIVLGNSDRIERFSLANAFEL